MSRRQEIEVEIEGRRLVLSNLDKVLYPALGLTKAQVIDYYRRVAPVLLPHLRDRPLTLKRYPEGVDGPFFYEKQCPSYRPAWVRTCVVPAKGGDRPIRYCLANDLPTLVWCANLASLELHPSLALAQALERPTMLVFDLDPGAPANVLDCAEVALRLAELLGALGLASFPKTSGGKGLQVYVPLNLPVAYAETKGFARAIAEILAQAHPDKVVSVMTKALRGGKVLIDWSQNDGHKTTVSVYSLRAQASGRVSTPLRWQEVERAAASRKAALLEFGPDELVARIDRVGDLFEPVLALRQRLPRSATGAGEGPPAA